jgi:tRNA G18 (ribose-2'-O)-methylase SpoU
MVRNRYEDSREKQEVSETPRFEDGRLVTTQYDPYRPENLPRTTAASEFLYGYSSVFAAIKAGRRTLYKLYIHERGLNHEGRDALFARARAAKLPMQEVGDDYLPLMDKASSGRPHNVSTVMRTAQDLVLLMIT